MKNVQSSESSGTNEECAELRVPLKMKTYGGEAECITPHKKNRGQAPIDLPKTLPEEAPRQKLQLSTMPCSFSFPCRKSRIPCWISKRYCKNSLRQLASSPIPQCKACCAVRYSLTMVSFRSRRYRYRFPVHLMLLILHTVPYKYIRPYAGFHLQVILSFSFSSFLYYSYIFFIFPKAIP